MKFRIRRSGRKIVSRLSKGTSPVYMGKNTLRKRSFLPKEAKNVPLVRTAQQTTQASHNNSSDLLSKLLRRILSTARRVSQEIISEIIAAWRRLVALVERLIVSTLNKKFFTEKGAFALMGAATACTLVTLLSALIAFIALFAVYARSYDEITIPSFVGEDPNEISVDKDKINLIIKYENNPDVPNGTIVTQSPRAGVTRRVYHGGEYCNVYLTVSRHERVTIPDNIVGMTLRDASLTLMNHGLQYKVKKKYSNSDISDLVLSCYPNVGETVKAGDTVTLTVSVGGKTQTILTPSLHGLSESVAVDRLQALGIELYDVIYIASDEKVGTVIAQSIPYGREIEKGSRMSITVSAGRIY